jgi:hypothetical protein
LALNRRHVGVRRLGVGTCGLDSGPPVKETRGTMIDQHQSQDRPERQFRTVDLAESASPNHVRAATRGLSPNHSRAVDRRIGANHSRAVDRRLSANHSRAVDRPLTANHARSVATSA